MTRLLSGVLLRVLIAGAFGSLMQISALAEGLAQVRFSGAVGPGIKSHLVEVEIGDAVGHDPVILHLHLAHGTTGAELAALVARRAKSAGLDVTLTASNDKGASLWIDRAAFVNVRLGAGLVADVSCVEGPPSLVKILPPQAIKQACRAHMTASTAIISNGRPPLRGSISLEAELQPKTDSAAIATALWEAGQKVWQSERPGSNAWRPIKAIEGGILTGFSATMEGKGDWRLEVTL